MPGATPLGLRYPLQGETVDAASWQNLATDIDAQMTVIQGVRDKAFRPPTASVGNSGGNVLPVTTAGPVPAPPLPARPPLDLSGYKK